jgi:hypothetical protein
VKQRLTEVELRSAAAVPQTALILVVTWRYGSGLPNFAVHSPEDSQRDRNARSARFQQAGPEGLFQYGTAAMRAQR